MAAVDYKYSNLKVHVQDQPESNQYAIGVEIGGAFVPFAILKKNAVESDIAEAQEAAAEAERQRAAQPQPQAPAEGETTPPDQVAPHATQ